MQREGHKISYNHHMLGGKNVFLKIRSVIRSVKCSRKTFSTPDCLCFNGLAMLLRGSHKVGIPRMQVTFYIAFGWSAMRIPPVAEPWKLYANAYDGSKTKIYFFPNML